MPSLVVLAGLLVLASEPSSGIAASCPFSSGMEAVMGLAAQPPTFPLLLELVLVASGVDTSSSLGRSSRAGRASL
jgi:hypothetical protein